MSHLDTDFRSGNVSPNIIDVMLHYYSSGGTPHPRLDAPAVQEAIRFLIENLLLDELDHSYVATDRGIAWVVSICQTVFPRSAWVDQAGDAISIDGSLCPPHLRLLEGYR